MNLFKRKYKRSEWFEGLLWAEKITRDQLNEYVDFGKCEPCCYETDKGVAAYYFYRNNILDQIENK